MGGRGEIPVEGRKPQRRRHQTPEDPLDQRAGTHCPCRTHQIQLHHQPVPLEVLRLTSRSDMGCGDGTGRENAAGEGGKVTHFHSLGPRLTCK